MPYPPHQMITLLVIIAAGVYDVSTPVVSNSDETTTDLYNSITACCEIDCKHVH